MLTTPAIITLAILALSIIFFVHGKLRSDLVAICVLLSLLLFGILEPNEALAGFSNPIVIMMVALFVVGGAIFQTGLAKMISQKMLALAGDSQFKLYLLVMVCTSVIGAFISNTGTVALMLPVVVSLAMSAKISPSRLLIPLAFASSMGGMLTLIGTPPNLIINSVLVDAGYDSLSFFAFTPVGIVCIVLGIVLLWPLSKLFLTKKVDSKEGEERGKSLNALATEYQLLNNLYRIRVSEDSPFIGKEIKNLDLNKKYNVNILEIRRRSGRFKNIINQKQVTPDTVIEERDVLYTMGEFDDVKNFVRENHLEWMDSLDPEERELESAPEFSGHLRFDRIGIAEAVILSNSRLIKMTIQDAGFRQNFNVNVLGIQRRSKLILQDFKEERINSGDMLLIQGEWKDIKRLQEQQSDLVIVGQPKSEDTKTVLTHKAPLAAIIMLGMVICMTFNLIPPVTAVMIAAVLMVLTGCLYNVEAAYKTINWQTIVLFGAMLPMADALNKTGITALVSELLVTNLGGYGPTIVLAGIYAATSMMTLFISNTVTAVLIAPIAMSAAIALGVSPYPFLFAVTVAASMAFASPFSTPPNVLVMSAGQYTFMDYVKVGIPMQLAYGIVMVFVLPLIFPF